ncbi:MAG: peptidoglycan DD-metalloendopeptidase family protein [Rhizobiales bacterium]|nr:peptidoglycan DD-metalloendopeptidase family protein [Hyphomicrobiales bacterium]
MRCVVDSSRSLHLCRLALLATISVAAAGCSADTGRFDSNPFQSRDRSASYAPSRDATGTVSRPAPRSSSVQSQPLPPPSGAVSQSYSYAPASPPPTVASAPRSVPAYQSYARNDVTGSLPAPPTRTAQGHRNWNWEGGTAITVQHGDTIDGIVRRYGVPASVIAEANNLPNGTALYPGQRLVIPQYDATGSVASRRTASSQPAQPPRAATIAAAPAGGGQHVHVIAPGETLMKLSRQYHKSLSEIAKANHIPPSTMVKVGDRIVIPGVRATQTAAVAAPAAPKAHAPTFAAAPQQPKAEPMQKVASVAPPAAKPAATKPIATKPVAAAPSAPVATANVVTPAAHSPEPPKVKAETASAMPSFRWPVRGRVITAFGPRPTGAQNDGINVSVPEGTPIRAAEDGVVAYAGNELKTYGNLVLVRHSNGYVTAYAHASEIMVKRDEPVKRGQVIAKVGQTGSVAAPQLHFEIRKGSTPVDPAPFLDKGGAG